MSKIEVDAIDKQSGSTLTLGGSGTAVTLACGATQTGFGRTGTVDWNTTPKTTGTFTAVSGDGFFLNTSGGVITANLPAGTAGAIVSFADYAGTWQTHNVTVTPNGTDKIGSVNASVFLNTEGQSVTFVFVDSTQGWVNVQDSTSNVRGNAFVVATGGTETTSGNCKIHTFTGPGTFTVTAAGACATNNIMSHVIVGGGGGGGVKRAGGGGAGGYREVKNPITPYTASPADGYGTPANRVTVTAQAYPIVVGAGGTSGTGANPICNPASPLNTAGAVSSFGGIISAGGGAGGGTGTPTGAGAPGASGGGGVHGMTGRPSPAANAGGSGNAPPVSPVQGFDGGDATQPEPAGTGGGGGGALNAGLDGGDGQSPTPGSGGAGATSQITAGPVSYAGGGGGGARPNGAQALGGTGGGGRGANDAPNVWGPSSTGESGTANTGGGGGGSADVNGAISGAGGSGIVIIRYKFQ